MGIFTKDKTKTPAQRFDALIAKAEAVSADKEMDMFVMLLQRLKNQKEDLTIRPVELCLDVLETILFVNDSDYRAADYLPVYYDAEKIYKEICVYDEFSEQFEDLRLILIEMFTTNGIYPNKMYDLRLFNTFEDKKKYVILCQNIIKGTNAKKVFGVIKEYGIQIREFMVGDEMYLNNLVRVAEKASQNSAANVDEIINEELDKIKHMNGIYNVDPVRIAKVEQDIKEATGIVKGGTEIIQQVTVKTEQLRQVADNVEKRIAEVEKREFDRIDAKLLELEKSINATIDDYINQQKKTISIDKELMLKQLFSDAQTELDKYKAMAKTITATTSMELANLNSEAKTVMDRVSGLLKDDEEVKSVLKNAEDIKEFRDKVNKLSILNDNNIETLGRTIGVKPEGSEEAGAQENTAAVAEAAEAQYPRAGAAVATTKYVVRDEQAVVVDDEDENRPIGPVNPLLDPNIPFAERYQLVQKAKKEAKMRGVHFHQKFDDVMIAVMENANPYLIGPSGCGKTYMVKQISELLNMEFIDIGYINEEYEILGFQTATGKYSRPNFYRCYKYGMIAFCDELDNGNSRATVKLNSFLSNSLDSSYSFPNGEIVARHHNFRIIAAGNTEGNGADANYSTREKIEESVQQRFLPIYIDYDNDVEKAILGAYDDWFQFIVLFRQATDKWAEATGGPAQGILTTRDTSRIKQYLDNKSFNMSQIVRYEFIQTKDAEYLSFLLDSMKRNANSYPGALEILKEFDTQVKAVREKGHN